MTACCPAWSQTSLYCADFEKYLILSLYSSYTDVPGGRRISKYTVSVRLSTLDSASAMALLYSWVTTASFSLRSGLNFTMASLVYVSLTVSDSSSDFFFLRSAVTFSTHSSTGTESYASFQERPSSDMESARFFLSSSAA